MGLIKTIKTAVYSYFSKPKTTTTTTPSQKITGTLPSQGGTSGSDTPSFTTSDPSTLATRTSGGGGGGSGGTSTPVTYTVSGNYAPASTTYPSGGTSMNIGVTPSTSAFPSAYTPTQTSALNTGTGYDPATHTNLGSSRGGTALSTSAAISPTTGEYISPYRSSNSQAFKESVKRAANFGAIGQYGLGTYVSDILEPWKYAATPTYETKVGYDIYPKIGRGTEIYNTGSSQPYISTKGMTYGEVSNFMPVSGLGEYTGGVAGKIYTYGKPVLSTAGFIGLSALAPEVGAGIIAGLGIKNIATATAPTTYTSQGTPFITGWERVKYGALGVADIGLGLYGFKVTAKNMADQITQSQIKSVVNLKPEDVKTTRVNLGEGRFTDYSKIYKTTGEADMVTKTLSIGKVVNGKYVLTGTQESFVRTYDFWRGIESKIYLGSGQKFAGFGKIYPVGTAGYTPSFTKISASKIWDLSSLTYGGKTTTAINTYTSTPAVISKMGGIAKGTKVIGSLAGNLDYAYRLGSTGFETNFPIEQIGRIKVIDISGGTATTGSTFGGGTTLFKTITRKVFPAIAPVSVSGTATTSATSATFAATAGAGLAAAISVKTSQNVDTLRRSLNIPSTAASLFQENKTRQTSAFVPITINVPKSGSSLMTAPVITTIQVPQLITEQTTTVGFPPITPPTVPTYKPPKPGLDVPLIPPVFPKLDFDFGLGSRKFKGKQRTKYTPSFKALVLNIRGKQPRGLETGARLRPITKGFKWEYKASPLQFKNISSGFKLPKFNLGIKRRKKKR